MNRPLHIVVDNTFPPRLARDLEDFWRSSFPSWTVRHETQIAKASTRDMHWIARLREIRDDGDWLVFTADQGKNDRKRNEKLPVLCKKHRHAYLIVPQYISEFDQYKVVLSAVWPDLPLVVLACEAIRHRPHHVKLGQLTLKKNRLTFQLRVQGKPIQDICKPEQILGLEEGISN